MAPRPLLTTLAPLAVVLIVAALLAGCVGPDQPNPASFAFDGDAALQLASALVDAGEPTHRVPGSPGHERAADWLEAAMEKAGPSWSVRRLAFTGSDLDQLDFGSAASFRDSAHYCSAEDRARIHNATMWNFDATFDAPGTDRMILLAAHWDSKAEANHDPDPALQASPVPGANDGASGVGVLLQLMRQLATEPTGPVVDVRVAFFDAEDGFEDCHPLAGSTHYATHHAAGVGRMILLDMVGDKQAQFVVEAHSEQSDPALRALLWSHAGDHGAFTTTSKQVTDDHVPFIERGIPAVDVIDFGRSDTAYGFPPYWHTTADTVVQLDAGMMATVGDMVWSTLMDPELVASWPTS